MPHHQPQLALLDRTYEHLTEPFPPFGPHRANPRHPDDDDPDLWRNEPRSDDPQACANTEEMDPGKAADRGRTPTPTASAMRRSSSVPARQLKSALISPIQPESSHRSSAARSKRAHFPDEGPRSDGSLRRTITAPADNRHVLAVHEAVQRQLTQPRLTTFDDEDLPELVAGTGYLVDTAPDDPGAVVAAELGDLAAEQVEDNGVLTFEGGDDIANLDTIEVRRLSELYMLSQYAIESEAEEQVLWEGSAAGGLLTETNEPGDDDDDDSCSRKTRETETMVGRSGRRLDNPSTPTRRPSAEAHRALQRLLSKRGPAPCAETALSVRGIQSTPEDSHTTPHAVSHGQHDMVHTAQTIHSAAGVCRILWEEPVEPRFDESLDSPVLAMTERPGSQELVVPDDITSHVSRSTSPMGHVRTKLTAWSWAREMLDEEEESEQWECPSPVHGSSASQQRSEVSEEPFAPPNTAQSSARHSARASPPLAAGHVGELDEDVFIELKGSKTRGSVNSVPSVAFPRISSSSRLPTAVNRNFSNLLDKDEPFRAHRDSVEMFRHKQEEGRLNHHLVTTADSFLLTKSKYDARRLRSAHRSGRDIPDHVDRFEALAPVLDPTPIMALMALKQSEPQLELTRADPSLGAKCPANLKHEDPHPDEHRGCGICEVDRPRWHEHHHGRKR